MLGPRRPWVCLGSRRGGSNMTQIWRLTLRCRLGSQGQARGLSAVVDPGHPGNSRLAGAILDPAELQVQQKFLVPSVLSVGSGASGAGSAAVAGVGGVYCGTARSVRGAGLRQGLPKRGPRGVPGVPCGSGGAFLPPGAGRSPHISGNYDYWIYQVQ